MSTVIRLDITEGVSLLLQLLNQILQVGFAIVAVLEHLVVHEQDKLVRLNEPAIGEEMVDLTNKEINCLDRLAATVVDPFMIPAIEIKTISSREIEIRFLPAVFNETRKARQKSSPMH